MKTVINQNIFQHAEGSSDSINNIFTIIHKLNNEGAYFGEVFMQKQQLGTFNLKYEKGIPNSQVNIDLSDYDPVSHKSKTGKILEDPSYEVGQDGYILLNVSGYHTGLYVTISTLGTEKNNIEFDSRKLNKGDIVSIRLAAPGTYKLTNTVDKNNLDLTVLKADNGKYSHPSELGPINNIVLSDKGFEPKAVKLSPLQALIIYINTPAVLNLSGIKVPGMILKKIEG